MKRSETHRCPHAGSIATSVSRARQADSLPHGLRQTRAVHPKPQTLDPKPHSEQRGAALVIAIAVLTILLAIGLTFFTVSRLELKTVTNIENTVRAELLADGAMNIAIGFLNHDKIEHPTVTSLDHAWRTYFNGAWVQGKLWAFPEQWNKYPQKFDGLAAGAVPTIFFTDEDGSGPIPGGGAIGHLYVPRYELNFSYVNETTNFYNLAANPFVIDPDGQVLYDNGALWTPDEGSPRITEATQVDRWADIDNDGDGLRDSVWIPLVADTLVGDSTVRDGCTVTEILNPGDGMDNDLDNGIELPRSYCAQFGSAFCANPCGDEYAALRDGCDTHAIDEDTETAVFIYYGGNDGLDNDNTNITRPTVDDEVEQRWFLTAPINNLDASNNYYMILRQVSIPGLPQPIDINTDPTLPWPTNQSELMDGRHRWVDVLDNDYDGIRNKHEEYYTPTDVPAPPYDSTNKAYVDYLTAIQKANNTAADNHLPVHVVTNLPNCCTVPCTPGDFDQLRGVHEISPVYIMPTGIATWRVRSTGEPVCSIVGRAAVLIKDEASKANLNVAGSNVLDIPTVIRSQDVIASEARPVGFVGDDGNDDVPYKRPMGFWIPSTASATSPSQYCTRVLPRMGPVESRRVANLLTGSPDGSAHHEPQSDTRYQPEYVMDMMKPGYGLVDDNGNALQLALNGIDDDGNGIPDEGLNPAYPNYLGLFEGVDEPGELQRMNPLRNLVAEGKIPESDGITFDAVDNNNNSNNSNNNTTVNERGELADTPLRTLEEVKRADGIGDGIFALLKDFITLYSTDRNNATVQALAGTYNYTVGGDVVTGRSAMLPSETAGLTAESREQSGLKVDYNQSSAGDIAWALIDNWALKSSTEEFLYEPGQEAPSIAFAKGLQQEGVTVENLDYAYTTVARSIVPFVADDKASIIYDRTDLDASGNPKPIPYTADQELRAHQIAANIVDGRDADHTRTLEVMKVDDTWWQGEAETAGKTTQKRKITYTVAGNEGIRINEMMVRPVRRVEAEMYKYITAPANNAELPTGDTDRSTTDFLCPNLFSLYATPQYIRSGPSSPTDKGVLDFNMGRGYFENQIKRALLALPAPLDLDDTSPFALDFEEFLGARTPLGKPWPPADATASGESYWTRDVQPLTGIGLSSPDNGVLGPDCAMSTERSTIPILVHRKPTGLPIETRIQLWPNIIQFRFGPGPGLPPGRYYLTVNTTTARINPTTGLPYVSVDNQDRDQMRYAVKYASSTGANIGMPLRSDGTQMVVGNTDILTDVYAEWFDPTLLKTDPLREFLNSDQWASTASHAPIVGYRRYWEFDRTTATHAEFQARATGWAFLPSRTSFADTRGYGQDDAFTVTIPPYADNPNDQVYLYLALCPGPLAAAARPEFDYVGNPYGFTPNGIDDDGDGVPDDGPANPAGKPETFNELYDDVDNDGDGVIDEGVELSINYFDFSQEPDHEWVEIENVSGQPVDISGWTLAVGGPDATGNIVTDDKVEMTIPDRMTFDPSSPVVLGSRPPENKLILAVDAMDLFGKAPIKNPYAWPEDTDKLGNNIDDDGDGVRDDGPTDPAGSPEAGPPNLVDDDVDDYIDDTDNLLFNNGIGLVRADLSPLLGLLPNTAQFDLRNVTAPQIPATNPYAWPEPLNMWDSISQSFVNLQTNGLDDDGDFLPMRQSLATDDPFYLDPTAGTLNPWGSPEPLALRNNDQDDDGDGFIDDSMDVPGVSVFENPQTTDATGVRVLQNLQTIRRIVQFQEVKVRGKDILLPGAVSTDNPEDIAQLVLQGGVFPDYPEQDGIDNDNDNAVLSRDHVNSLYRRDDVGDLTTYTDLYGNLTFDASDDGIDEGGYLKYVRRQNSGGEWWHQPSAGSFNARPVEFAADILGFSYNEPNTPGTWREYLGAPSTTAEKPPEWKEFVERRLFPGDNVIVTLFDGPAEKNRVVERVTYTEEDVINRSIDDGVPIPTDGDTVHGRLTLFEEASGDLSSAHLNFWPDNTMMLDFYRTLERKHSPLYNGDRFGTTNRWEATDGNYDDWSKFVVSPHYRSSAPSDGEIAVAWQNVLRNYNGTPLARNDAAFLLPLVNFGTNPEIHDMNLEDRDLAYLGYAPMEDFNGAPAYDRVETRRDWSQGGASASWNLEQGAYIGTGGSQTPTVYLGPPLPKVSSDAGKSVESLRWRDYRFMCNFKILNGADKFDVGVVFRWGRDGNTVRFYRLRVSQRTDATTNLVTTYYAIDKHWGSDEYTLTPYPLSVPEGRPGPPLPVAVEAADDNDAIQAEVRVEGDKIYAIINGVVLETADTARLRFALDDPHPAIDTGTVGLYCQGVAVAFDDVYVTERERNKPYKSSSEAARQPYLAIDRAFWCDPVTGEFSTSQPGFVLDPHQTNNTYRQVGDSFVKSQSRFTPTVRTDVTYPQGTVLGASFPNDRLAAFDTTSDDRFLLTVGQADFTLLYPNPSVSGFELNDATWAPLLNWTVTTTGEVLKMPQVWRPVFLYSLGEPEFQYSYRVSGGTVTMSDASPYTGFNYLLNNQLAALSATPALSWLAPQGLLSRYGYVQDQVSRKDPRISMYVAQNLDGFNPETAQRPDPVANVLPSTAEALFEWTADDGLENGQYDVYLNMGAYTDKFRDSDREKLTDADYAVYPLPSSSGLLTTLGRGLYGIRPAPDEFRAVPPYSTLPLPVYDGERDGLFDPDNALGGVKPDELPVDIELFTDNYGDGRCWPKDPRTGAAIAPTWRNLYRGLNGQDLDTATGKPKSDSFGQRLSQTPDTKGFIHYGVVRVKNNYLALYLRNWAKAGRPNRFLGLVLTPRDRTPGRINVNTVETRTFLDPVTKTYRPFNTLMGIPGVLLDNTQPRIEPDENPTPGKLDTAPENDQQPLLDRLPREQQNASFLPPGFADRARLIETGRPGTRARALDGADYPNRQDGRYYASLYDLISPDSAFVSVIPGLAPESLHPLSTLSLGDPRWGQDVQDRFEKLSNLVTLRSDVFEIQATVQAGYGIDANHDGQINYRNNDEFVVTAEKKIRSVYER